MKFEDSLRLYRGIFGVPYPDAGGVKFYNGMTGRELENYKRKYPRLREGDFWREINHPELNDTITYPGPFVKLSETSCDIRCSAPRIGEHNLEVYGELGLGREELVMMKQTGII